VSFIIASVCFIASGFIIWQIYRLDRDPEIPGPISHVIVPAAALPIVVFLSLIGLLALSYGLGLLEWLP
jgi:hypothetical protein